MSRKENPRLGENKMGTMPVGRLLVNMATPMIIAMLVQALYNVVDSYFVSRISSDETVKDFRNLALEEFLEEFRSRT